MLDDVSLLLNEFSINPKDKELHDKVIMLPQKIQQDGFIPVRMSGYNIGWTTRINNEKKGYHFVFLNTYLCGTLSILERDKTKNLDRSLGMTVTFPKDISVKFLEKDNESGNTLVDYNDFYGSFPFMVANLLEKSIDLVYEKGIIEPYKKIGNFIYNC